VAALGIADGGATVMGTSRRTAPRFAAFLNAAAMHADNFDDTNPQAMVERNGGIHATAPVLAAALAVAEGRKASGRDLAAALHAGIGIACRINHAIDARHYRDGFHATGTLSTFGAAAAAAMVWEAWRSLTLEMKTASTAGHSQARSKSSVAWGMPLAAAYSEAQAAVEL